MKYNPKTTLGERLDQSGLRTAYRDAIQKRQLKKLKQILRELELEDQIPILLDILHLKEQRWYEKLFATLKEFIK